MTAYFTLFFGLILRFTLCWLGVRTLLSGIVSTRILTQLWQSWRALRSEWIEYSRSSNLNYTQFRVNSHFSKILKVDFGKHSYYYNHNDGGQMCVYIYIEYKIDFLLDGNDKIRETNEQNNER